MALSGTIQWEVRAGSSDNNAGGFKPGASGTDYSQQASPQYALTGASTAGASATIVHASAATDMVGNIARVVSGTSAVVGFFEILSVVAGVSVTVDANVSTATTSNLVINIGGALGTIGRIGSSSANLGAVAGNTIWVRAGTYTLTASDTLSFAGTTTSPIRVVGYATTRGDGYLGRTNGNGPLITTNMPAFNYNATFRISVAASWANIECLNITTAVSNAACGVPDNGALLRCRVVNSSTNAAAVAVAFANRGFLYNNDIALTGGSGGTAAVTVTGTNFSRILSNRISGPGVGILVSSTCNILVAFNTVYGGTTAFSSTQTGTTVTLLNNTFVGGSSDGVSVASTTAFNGFLGNMVTDNGGYGINFQNATSPVFVANSRTRDNTSGAYNLATDWVAATNYNAVTTDTGGAATDYEDAGSNDYRLIAASPAAGVNQPRYASIGALQRDASGGGGGQKSFTFAT